MLSVVKPSVIMLSVTLLTVIILKVVVPRVEMPEKVNFFLPKFSFFSQKVSDAVKTKAIVFLVKISQFFHQISFSIFLAVKFSFDKKASLIFVALRLVHTMAKVALS